MNNYPLHNELKTAIRLRNTTIKAFASTLKKPDGSTGVSHTAVIRVAQGHDETEWILEEINQFVSQSKKTFPEYYDRRERIESA